MAQDTAAMHNKKETQHHQPRKLQTPARVGSTLALEEGDRTPGGVAEIGVVQGNQMNPGWVRWNAQNTTKEGGANGRLLALGQRRIHAGNRIRAHGTGLPAAITEMERHERQHFRSSKAQSTEPCLCAAQSSVLRANFWLLRLAALNTPTSGYATQQNGSFRDRLLDVLAADRLYPHAHRPFRIDQSHAIVTTPAMPLLQRINRSTVVRRHPSQHCDNSTRNEQAAPSSRKLIAALTTAHLLRSDDLSMQSLNSSTNRMTRVGSPPGQQVVDR